MIGPGLPPPAVGQTFADLLDDVADQDDPWLVLTDEELYAVTSTVATEDRLLPLDVVAAMEPRDRGIAVAAACRSLIARGLVVPVEETPHVRDVGPVELEVRAPLLTVLEVLASSWPTVLATRQRDGAVTHRVMLTIGRDAVLEHESRDGFHRFAWFRPARACIELASFLDAGGAGATDPDAVDVELVRGPVDRPPTAWGPLRRRLDASPVSSQLLAFRAAGSQPERLVFEFVELDGDLVQVTGEHAGPDGDATEVVARCVSARTVLGLAAHALSLDPALGTSDVERRLAGADRSPSCPSGPEPASTL